VLFVAFVFEFIGLFLPRRTQRGGAATKTVMLASTVVFQTWGINPTGHNKS